MMLEAAIRFVLANFTLSFLAVGAVAALVLTWRGREAAEAWLASFLFCSIGLSLLYNGVIHIAFGAMAARFIGWADSPFQTEVGVASLGFGAVGVLAAWGGRGMRFAAILGPAIFLWGAAAGHLRQIAETGNMAPGNAGVALYGDIAIPLLGFALFLWRHGGPAASRAGGRSPARS